LYAGVLHEATIKAITETIIVREYFALNFIFYNGYVNLEAPNLANNIHRNQLMLKSFNCLCALLIRDIGRPFIA